MTEKDLNQIEKRLRITLPADYRRLMPKLLEPSASKGSKPKARDRFGDALYLDPKTLISTNRIEGQSDSDLHQMVADWPKKFVLIGTNGAGDYYCLKLKGDRKVWMIGSDCGEKPSVVNTSLKAFVDELEEIRSIPPAPPPPVYSSFDESCPILERFKLFIGRITCEIQAKESDRPFTVAKLRQHGIDINEVGRGVLHTIAALAKCDPESLSIKPARKTTESEYLTFNMTEATPKDPRIEGVSANLFRGMIIVTLYGPAEATPDPKKAGVNWKSFQKEVQKLLWALHPSAKKVLVSEPRTRQSKLDNQWSYDLNYLLQ